MVRKIFNFGRKIVHCLHPSFRSLDRRPAWPVPMKRKKKQKHHRYSFFFFFFNLFHINVTHLLHMSCCDRMNDENKIFAFKSFYDLFILWIPCSFLYWSLLAILFWYFSFLALVSFALKTQLLIKNWTNSKLWGVQQYKRTNRTCIDFVQRQL